MTARAAKLIALVAAISIAIAAVLTPLLQQERHFFPWLKVAAPDNLEIRFLLAGQQSRAQCASLVASMVSATRSTCKTCKVIEQTCLDHLDADQEDYLDATPLDMPVVHMANGVIIFTAPGENTALAACQESGKQAVNGQMACYPAGSARPVLLLASTEAPLRDTLHSPIFWGILSLTLLAALCYPVLVSRATNLSASLIAWPRRWKQLLVLLVDTASLEFSLWAAFALRLDTLNIPLESTSLLFLIAPAVAFPVFVHQGLYHSIIRYLGLHALLNVGKAVAIYILLLATASYMLSLPSIPRSVLIIHGVLTLVLVGLSRTVARYWLRFSQVTAQPDLPRKNVIIYGAGAAGIQLASALAQSREYRPVALLDDDPALHRQRLGALEVFPPEKIASLIDQFGVQEVLLAIPSASRTRRNEIMALLEPLPVHVRTLPGLTELAGGKIKTEDLREVEIEDLLGRDPVAPDPALLQANIAGKSVMVTGAGGSIGSELCRQILAQGPMRLVLFEQSEFALYSIEQDLISRLDTLYGDRASTRPEILPLLGTVTDQARIERAIDAFRVQTIFHAAAYKHVPMVERNPCEGAFNNIFGTYRAAMAAINRGVETFVLISTDKAVRPTNSMGTTKRFAEMILQALAERYPEGTRFTMVRFGNVLGSSGSVVPLFREQIRRGGPITVTDPRIIRYFMTIPEAAQLVIQAGAMGKDGDVFVLDMGEPVKIVDLAHRMVHLSGLTVKDNHTPCGDIEIVFSGLRPGEKLYEELLIGDDVSQTSHPRILRANEKMLPLERLEALLHDLSLAVAKGDSVKTRELLKEAVEEFTPLCSVQDLTLKAY